jgi:hypothetical protein
LEPALSNIHTAAERSTTLRRVPVERPADHLLEIDE